MDIICCKGAASGNVKDVLNEGASCHYSAAHQGRRVEGHDT